MARKPSVPVVPFSFQVLLLVIGGTISVTQGWSMGVHIIHDNSDETPSAVDLATLLSAYEGPTRTWATAVKGDWAPATELSQLSLYSYVPTSGKAHAVSHLSTPSINGTGTSILPSQACIVATKHSNLSGASATGRCYLPGTALPLGSNYQISTAEAQSLAEHTASWMTAINSVNGTAVGLHNMACVIASRTTQTFHPIDEITVDTRADTQRRRADKIRPAGLGQSPVGG